MMRVRKPSKPVELTCVDCKKTFIAYSRSALRCSECKQDHLRRIKVAAQAVYRSPAYINAKGKKKPPKMSLREVLKELESYNKENNTCLSYGEFVTMLDKGVQRWK